MDEQRFVAVKREALCICGMPIYDVTDTGLAHMPTKVSHIGYLKWYDAADQAARRAWEAEIRERRD